MTSNESSVEGKFCCFFCPDRNDDVKHLSDECPSCGRPYGFPLFNPPKTISDDFTDVEPLGRGFYAATFRAINEYGVPKVLKVTPKSFYEFEPFNKIPFIDEVQAHARVADRADFIVGFDRHFTASVTFGDEAIDCNVMILDNIDGELLQKTLTRRDSLSSETIAQIAIDLLYMREEFEERGVHHNDLHAGNIIIENRSKSMARANAVDKSIRAVAIDLGSMSEESKTGRLDDLHQIAGHCEALIEILRANPDEISDRDYRLSEALRTISETLNTPVDTTRIPSAADLDQKIKQSLHKAAHKQWNHQFQLSYLPAHYNAQTMFAWDVPMLLVDEDEQWLKRVSSPGPQIITGMRGCGKTMLLRSLEGHARIANVGVSDSDAIREALRSDGFVGVYVPASRTLATPRRDIDERADPYVRLFAEYVSASVEMLTHLQDKVPEALHDHASEVLHKCVARNVRDFMSDTVPSGLEELSRFVADLIYSIKREPNRFSLAVSVSDAFVNLAESIISTSEVWQNSRVLFLLDDLSTRYFKSEDVGRILSDLLFQDPRCSFKFTSEGQTILLGLKMPGENLWARVGRDLEVFDLGADVLEKIKGKTSTGGGKKFVNRILMKRVEGNERHEGITPLDVLGDVPLVQIARDIAHSRENSTQRKNAYRGLSALTHVCVGDIGDVLRLYDLIFNRKTGKGQVPDAVQAECFRDYSSNMLHALPRDEGIREYAKSFAEAAHEMLLKSGGDERLRQYYAIYLNVSGENVDAQLDKIRELVDKAVFVFSGGVPRKKTRDQNIFRQFILEYRKIHGLGNFIGLSNKDRFELSGENLEEWLGNPDKCKEILMRAPRDPVSEEYSDREEEHVIKKDLEDRVRSEAAPLPHDDPSQISLFDQTGVSDKSTDEAEIISQERWVQEQAARLKILPIDDISRENIDGLVVALGFEKRTEVSVERILNEVKPNTVFAVEYPEPGRSEAIKETLAKAEASTRVLKSSDFSSQTLSDLNLTMVDISGLSKPIIFEVIRNELLSKGRVIVAYTEAEKYYPLEEELAGKFDDMVGDDKPALLETVDDVVTGEEGPFEAIPLQDDASIDDARKRALFAFSSAKHKRLQYLLESRDLDRLEIVVPPENGPRNAVARLNAEVSVMGAPAYGLIESDSNDIEQTFTQILTSYYLLYVKAGMNFEFGLTGSKLQAVICAAVSSQLKISQSWYVRPRKYDKDKFTEGAGPTKYFYISIE